MASLGQPLAQAVQPVQWVWSAKWGKGRSSALTGASSGVWGRSSRAQRRLSRDYLRSPSPRRLNRLKVRELSGAAISAGATAVKKGFWNWTENTVPWKELVHT